MLVGVLEGLVCVLVWWALEGVGVGVLVGHLGRQQVFSSSQYQPLGGHDFPEGGVGVGVCVLLGVGPPEGKQQSFSSKLQTLCVQIRK